jgi:hypothetical protein
MGRNIINREPGLTNSRFEFFHIRVLDFQTLGDDIDKLFGHEQLFNKIVYIKIERKWRTRNE